MLRLNANANEDNISISLAAADCKCSQPSQTERMQTLPTWHLISCKTTSILMQKREKVHVCPSSGSEWLNQYLASLIRCLYKDFGCLCECISTWTPAPACLALILKAHFKLDIIDCPNWLTDYLTDWLTDTIWTRPLIPINRSSAEMTESVQHHELVGVKIAHWRHSTSSRPPASF